MEPPEKRIFIQGIELSREGAGEWRKGQRTALVARPIIRDLALARGLVEERPVARIVIGGIVSLVGLLSLLGVAAIGLAAMGLGVIGAIFTPLGLVVFIKALRRGPYLRVTTTVGEQKLLFDGPVDEQQLAASLARAREELDLPPAR